MIEAITQRTPGFGTLEDRFGTTATRKAAAGVVRAKTGTLTGDHAMAGWQQPAWSTAAPLPRAEPAWLCRCTAFPGRAGYADLEPHPDALAMIRSDLDRHG